MAIAGPEPTVRTIKLTVYVHHERLTAEADEAVDPVTVTIIIAKNKRLGQWHLDCVDTEDLDVVMPRRANAARKAVLQKAMTILGEMGIDPKDVRGWTKWFDPKLAAEVLNGH